jgi:hypothetical protein
MSLPTPSTTGVSVLPANSHLAAPSNFFTANKQAIFDAIEDLLSASNSFHSAAAMIAADVTIFQNGDLITTAGYAAAGDGGAAKYQYSAASVATEDGGSVLAPSGSQPGRFLLVHDGVFNVKQFGAKGDGTMAWYNYLSGSPVPATPTDDFAALQAAIDFGIASGARMLSPTGIYRSTGMLVIKKGAGLTWEGANLFRYPGGDSEKLNNTIIACDYPGTLLTIRGMLVTPPGGAIGGDDVTDYTVSSGYRCTGVNLSNIQFGNKRLNTSFSTALVLMKRLARCTFTNLTFANAPAWGLEALAIDDSIFDRCFFYVCGNISQTYAARMRGSVVLGSGANTETTYTLTNGVTFRNVDYEGNWYGHMEAIPLSDSGQITAVNAEGCVGKIVPVQVNGKNAFSFYRMNNSNINLTAALGENSTTPDGTTATEIVRMEYCQGILFDMNLGVGSRSTSGTAQARMRLTRAMTLVDCMAIKGRFDLYTPGDNLPLVDDYLVNAVVGSGFIQPTQIEITGTFRSGVFPLTIIPAKKICNVEGIPQNNNSHVLLGELLNANFAVTTDQQIALRMARFKIRYINVEKASVSMDTTLGGIYLGASKNTAIVSAGQAYTGLITTTDNFDLTLASNITRTGQPLFFSLTRPQLGSPTKTASTVTHSGPTATFNSTSHGFSTGNWVGVFGATQTEYNGNFQITVVDANSFTYVMGSTPSTDATGTLITASLIKRVTPNGSGVTRNQTTVTFNSTAHGLVATNLVQISGADQSELNGTFVINTSVTDSFTITVVGSPVTTPFTGTIVATLLPSADIRIYGDIFKF